MQEDLVTKQWRGNILIALNSLYSDCEYSILKDQRLAGLYICIVVHKRIKEKVSELQATGIAVGVLGKIVWFLFSDYVKFNFTVQFFSNWFKLLEGE